MSHRTALELTAVPRYVVQRGIDDFPCFLTDEDYLVYLDCLKEGAERHRCAIHAYALTTDHVHLLVGSETDNRPSLMMRYVSGRYAEYVSYIYQRNRSFWERRLESAVIDSERFLLACYRYIESYPVRAGIAASPADYRWSSYNHHAHGCEDMVIRDHPSYVRLGAAERERQLAYRESFDQLLGDWVPAEISNCGVATGGDRARDRIERLSPRMEPVRSARARKMEYATAAA